MIKEDLDKPHALADGYGDGDKPHALQETEEWYDDVSWEV